MNYELSCCLTPIFDNYYIIISSIITIIQQFLFFIIYCKMPLIVKKTVFIDFPIYNK
jgi:hypothetical protein